MDIRIRPTLESDLERLLRIRADPLVNKTQLSPPHLHEEVVEALFVNNRSEHHTYEWHTILESDELVGYITTTTFMSEEIKIHYVGFNLDPEFWDRGIMTRALALRVGQIFDESKEGLVVAEAICTNHSCIRVLEKLNFSEYPIGFVGRIIRYLTSKYITWTNKYHLDVDDWRKANQEHKMQ